MASVSNTSSPSGILRRRPSVEKGQTLIGKLPGKGMIARARHVDIHLGSPTSRAGVHFAAPDNLSDLLSRAASKERIGTTNRKVLMVQYGTLSALPT